MNNSDCEQSTGIPDELIEAPAFPNGASRVFRELKKALDIVECGPDRAMTQKFFAQLLGAPRSTVNDWLHCDLPEPIRYFVCGLERLPDENRSIFLRRICRYCPRLQDARLAYDPRALNGLRALLAKHAGLTFIAGPSDLRMYLLTAIGHSAVSEVVGFDVHPPKRFVPVHGVLYLRRVVTPDQVRRLLQEAWPIIAEGAARLVLLNGVWKVAPDFRTRAIHLARKRHVVVADDFGNEPPAIDSQISGNLVKVSYLEKDLGRLAIQFETVRARR